jgi:uncharacterized protein (TIGR02186 family)
MTGHGLSAALLIAALTPGFGTAWGKPFPPGDRQGPTAIEQAKKKAAEPATARAPRAEDPAPTLQVPLAAPSPPLPPPAQATPPAAEPSLETIEIDVSTRTVAVTSAFAGTEIVIFGSVGNSRQESAESGYYDVVLLVEGKSAPSVVRLKTNVGGLWINTKAVRFPNLPIYSATASTRPLDEIAEPRVLVASGVGFSRARMYPGKGSTKTTIDELEAYKSAFLRLKERDGLYVRQSFGVAFIGRSLFRASIKLPANIPVGPLSARVFLFREGQMLATHTASVVLERQGLERLIYDFSSERPVLYGIAAVVMAILAGLAGSILGRRPG